MNQLLYNLPITYTMDNILLTILYYIIHAYTHGKSRTLEWLLNKGGAWKYIIILLVCPNIIITPAFSP